MGADGWLADTRASYDTVAESYADLLRDALSGATYERAILGLFAELVRTSGGGPVADIGCGPGRITAYLHNLGVDAFGIDLSPAMIDLARRDHAGLRFEVGSMTDLDLTDSCVAGVLACKAGVQGSHHLRWAGPLLQVAPGAWQRVVRVLRRHSVVVSGAEVSKC
ncbi:class I SAM-dependent methyltransferase [Micromonospora sp. NBC_00898]|uniref:class I SAM-dependent DNA methyltransferase n=1 Tax=Micromonospora sp. NBC_00898 TaxID=2975981 RepID=UPI00386BED1F|nr:class I SAM-dependent methyltransferase [Micromonospora sp. NBC_00898]